MKKSPIKRHAIPAPIRMNVWAHYIGDTLQGKCLCCERESITIANFECGHVVSVAMGGKDTIANMRPICSMCNKSMGTQNMDEFIARIRGSEGIDQIVEQLAGAHISNSHTDPDASIDEVANKMECLALSHDTDSEMPDIGPRRIPRAAKKEPRVSEFFNIPHAFIRELTPELIRRYCINILQDIDMDTLYCEFLQWCSITRVMLVDILTFASKIAQYVKIISDSSGQCSAQFSRNSVSALIREHDKKVAPFWDFDVSRSFLDDVAHGRVARLVGYDETNDGDVDCEIVVSKKSLDNRFLKWRNKNAVTKSVSNDEFAHDILDIAGAAQQPSADEFAFSIAKLRRLAEGRAQGASVASRIHDAAR